MIIHKSKDGQKLQNRSRSTKMTIRRRDAYQLYQKLQPARIRSAKYNNNQQDFILHRYLCHHHRGNFLQKKPGRIIQPNSLLKVLTANVQSLSQRIDELIALIQVKNIDVIALKDTWLDTQCACRSCHSWL